MLGFWRNRSLFRESLVAFFCALTLLAGVMQARSGTELAANSGFLSALALCQQSGSGGGSPDPDPNCDHCRMPAPLGLGAPVSVPSFLRTELMEKAASPTPSFIASSRTLLPEARGPPQRG